MLSETFFSQSLSVCSPSNPSLTKDINEEFWKLKLECCCTAGLCHMGDPKVNGLERKSGGKSHEMTWKRWKIQGLLLKKDKSNQMYLNMEMCCSLSSFRKISSFFPSEARAMLVNCFQQYKMVKIP